VTVFCLGDLMVDVVARLFGPLAEGSDSPGVISYVGGGSAANTAAWLTRVAESAVFVGAIGDDAAGQAQVESLHRLGVDVRFRVDRTRPTGTCLVLVAPTGERTMVPDPGANLALLEHDVPVDEFRPGDHLHVSGYALLREPAASAAERAVELARAAGARISLDLSAWSLVDDPFRERARRVAPDVVLATEGERDTFGPLDSVWVVKRGAHGVRVDGVDRPALPAEIVDPTGAGDAFAAGFLVGGVELGLEAAARCCAKLGAMP
jgi:ribokinase